MKFLCLHGIGTSSKVFEVQTAALRYQLGDQHSYEFVEGVVPCDMAPELSALSDPSAAYYAYFDAASMPSAMAALAQLDAYERAEGPFDAVLAFSQGAGLAAAFMMQRALAEPLRRPPFRCAVLVSCVWVYDPVAWAERGEVRTLHGSALGEVVAVPTVHVWGARDPRRAESEGMRGFCKAELATVFVHGGGHEVPGLGAKEAVSGTVKAIRRGITLATLAEAEQPVAV